MTDPDPLMAEAQAALGVSDLHPLRPGGQKHVFRAELEGAPVVVKLVTLEEPFAEEALLRARREVDLLSVVDSMYVVAVLSEAIELGEPTSAVCWVEELLDGADLGDRIGTPWSFGDALRLLHDVGRGLAACHELDVVHRDLSPGNVRCRQDGRFTLMDPGFARHLAKTAITGRYQPGTLGYMSPEHVPGGQPIPASDVFALGILAFHALTGGSPVDPSTFATVNDYYGALADDQAPPVVSRRADVPPALAAVVDRCLRRQPARRYLDAGELVDAVGEVQL